MARITGKDLLQECAMASKQSWSKLYQSTHGRLSERVRLLHIHMHTQLITIPLDMTSASDDPMHLFTTEVALGILEAVCIRS